MRQVLTSENHSMCIQMTSFVQFTKQSYSYSNPVVRWMYRREIHWRKKVYSVISGRERPSVKRSSVKRTVIGIKFVFSLFFSFCFRCCWRFLLKIAKLKITLFNASFGVQVISIVTGKRSIQPIRIPVRSLLNKSRAQLFYNIYIGHFQVTFTIEMSFSCTFIVL